MQLNFDKRFLPMICVLRDFKKQVAGEKSKTFKICVERNNGYNCQYSLDIFDSEDLDKKRQNYLIVERIIKTILWIAGGYKIYLCGDKSIYSAIKADYSPTGARNFDVDFMQGVYEMPFEVIETKNEDFPRLKESSLSIGGHLNGERIGLDVGGSDIKISAVKNGKVVYSEEIIWNPKQQSNYEYHYQTIKNAIKKCADKLDNACALGVSTAGVCINNRVMVSALFIKVPKQDFNRYLKDIYINIAKELNLPVEVANDGDVTALAGAMEFGDNCVLGIALGTSEAGGYINENGGLNGWISELAFVPLDFDKNACRDEWSGDCGCGVKYLSQDGVIKLAILAGIEFEDGLTPAEKLKKVQSLLMGGDKRVICVYEDIGAYLGYAIAYYAQFYKIKKVQVLGRVVSGLGGEIIVNKARQIISKEFGEYAQIVIELPEESSRRVGQSVAAASLK